jgi:TRAP-type C4-dicarboxylate transport system permease small subunit
LQRFYDTLDKTLTAVLLVLVVLMVLSISTEILLNAVVQPVASHLLQQRGEGELPILEGTVSFVAKASSPVNTASQTLLVWIGILGGALAFRRRAHLGVDALVRVYPRPVRVFLDYASTVLVGLFSLVVLGIGGYMVCQRAFSDGSRMPGLDVLNRGWFYLVLVITGVLNLAYCVYHFTHPRSVGEASPRKEDAQNS